MTLVLHDNLANDCNRFGTHAEKIIAKLPLEKRVPNIFKT